MKMLISFLIFFTGIALLIAAGAAGLVQLGEGIESGWKEAGIYPGFWGYLMLAGLNLMLAIGLVLSVISTISGAFLSLMSFAFKSWSRAIVSAGMCYASILLWNYLLECRI